MGLYCTVSEMNNDICKIVTERFWQKLAGVFLTAFCFFIYMYYKKGHRMQIQVTSNFITLHTSCGAVYCNRPCLFVGVCLFVGLLPR